MCKNLLITGVTGLIGQSVLNKLISSHNDLKINALVRPGTSSARFSDYQDKVSIEFIDLSKTDLLNKYLRSNKFDIILHIGAIRGGRNYSKFHYEKTNIDATEQLVEYSLKNKARFIYCSSVGVYGAIPEELPANNESPYKNDNYYHYTKIMAEKIINKTMLMGLNAVILRPSITYGKGDIGFPNQLVKLVKTQIFPLSNKNIWIHLCHIDTISLAFVKLVKEKAHIHGKAYNIADVEPVQLRDLVNFINRELYKRNYPQFLTIDNNILLFGEYFSRFLNLEKWKARFELISHNWFYNVRNAYEDLDLPEHFTIPDFKIVIE